MQKRVWLCFLPQHSRCLHIRSRAPWVWQAQRWVDLGRQPPTPSQHRGPSWNPLEFDALRRRELWTYPGSQSRECSPSLKYCCRRVLPSRASRVRAQKSIRLSIRNDARSFNTSIEPSEIYLVFWSLFGRWRNRTRMCFFQLFQISCKRKYKAYHSIGTE